MHSSTLVDLFTNVNCHSGRLRAITGNSKITPAQRAFLARADLKGFAISIHLIKIFWFGVGGAAGGEGEGDVCWTQGYSLT